MPESAARELSKNTRPRAIDLTPENIKAGVDLFDAYRRAMLLGNAWNASPESGFDMIPGVASEVLDMPEDYRTQLRIIGRVTGCGPDLIHAVLETMDVVGCPSPCWVGARPAHIPFDELRFLASQRQSSAVAAL